MDRVIEPDAYRVTLEHVRPERTITEVAATMRRWIERWRQRNHKLMIEPAQIEAWRDTPCRKMVYEVYWEAADAP